MPYIHTTTFDTRAVAERSRDAFSVDRYRPSGWHGCVLACQRLGFDEWETEAILRSKLTRWAGDASSKPYGRLTGQDLRRFLEQDGWQPRTRRTAEYVLQTFNGRLPDEVHQFYHDLYHSPQV